MASAESLENRESTSFNQPRSAGIWSSSWDEAHELAAGVPDGTVGRAYLVQVVGVDEEVVRAVQVSEPPLVRAINGTVVADDQLVRAQRAEPLVDLVEIGHPVERMDDEGQLRALLVA